MKTRLIAMRNMWRCDGESRSRRTSEKSFSTAISGGAKPISAKPISSMPVLEKMALMDPEPLSLGSGVGRLPRSALP